MNNTEQPLVGWKEIAKELKVCEDTARKMLKGAPFIPGYRKSKAIFPSKMFDFLNNQHKTH